MSMIYLILPLALLIAAAALAAFVWATRSGQFDDLETPGMRVLHEDDPHDPDSDHHTSPKEGTPLRRADPGE